MASSRAANSHWFGKVRRKAGFTTLQNIGFPSVTAERYARQEEIPFQLAHEIVASAIWILKRSGPASPKSAESTVEKRYPLFIGSMHGVLVVKRERAVCVVFQRLA
jgi:hypothetical protein